MRIAVDWPLVPCCCGGFHCVSKCGVGPAMMTALPLLLLPLLRRVLLLSLLRLVVRMRGGQRHPCWPQAYCCCC